MKRRPFLHALDLLVMFTILLAGVGALASLFASFLP
jgi:hypothetical protein